MLLDAAGKAFVGAAGGGVCGASDGLAREFPSGENTRETSAPVSRVGIHQFQVKTRASVRVGGENDDGFGPTAQERARESRLSNRTKTDVT